MRTFPTSLLMLLLVLPGLSGCPKKKTSSSKAPQAAPGLVVSLKKAAQGWLPKNRDGSRFVVDSAKGYDKETVFELLNGGADALIDAGMTSLIHVRLKDTAGKFTPSEIQISDYTTAAKAKAMLAQEKPTKAQPVKIGDRGYAQRDTVMFVKGRHLVSVSVQPMGKINYAPVAEIALRVASTPNARW
jgi:Family of unknown function (DUF6599)